MTHFHLNSFRFTIRFFHSTFSFSHLFFVTWINIILFLFEILPFDRINLPSLLVTSFHLNYPFFTLTLVCNPFHGRYLSSNSITSIPSGAFSGLTALNTLWGKGLLYLCVDRLCFLVWNPLIVYNCFRVLCTCSCIISCESPELILLYKFSCFLFSFLEIFKNLFLLSPLHNIWAMFPSLSHHRPVILSMIEISLSMPSPIFLVALSPAWRRWIRCEGGGCILPLCKSI